MAIKIHHCEGIFTITCPTRLVAPLAALVPLSVLPDDFETVLADAASENPAVPQFWGPNPGPDHRFVFDGDRRPDPDTLSRQDSQPARRAWLEDRNAKLEVVVKMQGQGVNEGVLRGILAPFSHSTVHIVGSQPDVALRLTRPDNDPELRHLGQMIEQIPPALRRVA